MEPAQNPQKPEPQKSFWSNFLWWNVDRNVIDAEAKSFATLPFLKKSKNTSGLLLCFSAVVTVALSFLVDTYDLSSSALDIVLLCFLIPFVFLGYAGAFIAAMIYWTSSKLYLIGTKPSTAFVQILWWAFYMRCFYSAYLVERKLESMRPKPPTDPAYSKKSSDSISSNVTELEKLFELKTKGALTDDEFNNAKKRMGM